MAQMLHMRLVRVCQIKRDTQRQQIREDGCEATHFAREHYNAIENSFHCYAEENKK